MKIRPLGDRIVVKRGQEEKKTKGGIIIPDSLEKQGQADSEPIKLIGIIVDQVGQPRNDGSPGSALYEVPFKLSREPSSLWSSVFVETWNRPPRFTSMHRPGIARVEGNKILLDGTTIEEVEKYHLDTLKIVIARTNELIAEREASARRREEESKRTRQQHMQRVRQVAERLKFDNN